MKFNDAGPTMMKQTVVPMLHVPDVRATVDWYRDIGFEVSDAFGDGGDGLSFAILSYGAIERPHDKF